MSKAIIFLVALSIAMPAFAGTGPNGGNIHGKGASHSVVRTSPHGKR